MAARGVSSSRRPAAAASAAAVRCDLPVAAVRFGLPVAAVRVDLPVAAGRRERPVAARWTGPILSGVALAAADLECAEEVADLERRGLRRVRTMDDVALDVRRKGPPDGPIRGLG